MSEKKENPYTSFINSIDEINSRFAFERNYDSVVEDEALDRWDQYISNDIHKDLIRGLEMYMQDSPKTIKDIKLDDNTAFQFSSKIIDTAFLKATDTYSKKIDDAESKFVGVALRNFNKYGVKYVIDGKRITFFGAIGQFKELLAMELQRIDHESIGKKR